ncbi:MAG: hydantoinase/carbamoylase family amidase [Alphaproteobacteria bacterium]|jgi:N-carbamoyl-L-amino-acid hydrolase|nr:hydantoinase/carbamoylase family amidase [Alphaproteobacteria bacterium]
MHNLRIDAERLWDSLMETARIGATAKGGIRRLTLSEEDKAVRDWFKAACEAIGCTVSWDDMGNMYAVYPGKHPDRLPIAMGSHLDTQPTGGKFDGVLGVLAGLEVLRTLHDAGYEPDTPLMLVNWTNEEGARYQPSMMGSAVYAGALTRERCYDQTDGDGVRFEDALEAIGYKGETPAGPETGAPGFAGMFELHIEQGPILEAEDRTIGVVTGIQGMRWYKVFLTGKENHAGTTPMHLRQDAMVGAARLTLAVNEIARSYEGRAVGTVGRIEIRPGSPNVVPGDVFFTVDFRSPDAAILDAMEAGFREVADAVTAEHGLGIDVQKVSDSPPVTFDGAAIDAVRASADSLGYSHREMLSGAGHDAGYAAYVAPTAMIFVPCKDGLSHNELEDATAAHCAAGANVLLQAVLARANAADAAPDTR